jgi:hypothetical protein
MNISSYDLSTQIGSNASYSAAIYHRIDTCLGEWTSTVTFATSSIQNMTEPVGALYVTVNNRPTPSATGNYGNPIF